MMKSLREVNIDHNSVGWYQSTYLGSYVTQQLIETQFAYQQDIPNSVCIVYGSSIFPFVFVPDESLMA
jgi:translation initiation factor 3 subunit H